MAKVIAPLFSLEARGRFGDALIYSQNGPTRYTKAYAVPTNPQSNPQTAVRAAITGITQAWQTLTAPQQALWEPLAEELDLTPYHAYLRFNTQRWAHHQLPARTPTPGDALSYSSTGQVITRGTTYEILLFTVGQTPDAFAIQLAASTSTPVPTEKDNTIVINATPAQTPGVNCFWEFEWTPPDASYYYLRWRPASESGEPSPWSATV